MVKKSRKKIGSVIIDNPLKLLAYSRIKDLVYLSSTLAVRAKEFEITNESEIFFLTHENPDYRAVGARLLEGKKIYAIPTYYRVPTNKPGLYKYEIVEHVYLLFVENLRRIKHKLRKLPKQNCSFEDLRKYYARLVAHQFETTQSTQSTQSNHVRTLANWFAYHHKLSLCVIQDCKYPSAEQAVKHVENGMFDEHFSRNLITKGSQEREELLLFNAKIRNYLKEALQL